MCVCVCVCVGLGAEQNRSWEYMPLSADRCQVTWGPSPLKRAEVGRGGICMHACMCGCSCSEYVHVCQGGVILKSILGDWNASGCKIYIYFQRLLGD